jgi:ornithine--oxo-acid transaminase
MSDINVANKNMAGYSDLADSQIIDFENRFGAHHYGRLGLVVRHAKGAWLTTDGDKYLDCLAAYSAAKQGHHHPISAALVKALQEIMPRSFQCGLYRCFGVFPE